MKLQCLLFFFLSSISLFAFTNETDSLNLELYIKNNNILTKKAKDGFYYTIEKEGRGTSPKRGDYVMINFKGKLLNGKIFDQSGKNDPFVFQLGYRQVIRGWDLGLRKLKVGSQATFYLPPNLAYGKTGVGKMIPPNAPLIFEIELVKILTPQEYDQYMVELEKKEREIYKAKQKAQFNEDLNLIKEYISSNKLKAKKLSSGLSYIIKKKGKGQTAQVGDFLKVQYEGKLLDGTRFTKQKETHQFTLGRAEVIKGWDEGLQQLGKGGEAWLLIPSSLAYGPRAIQEEGVSIPENSVLVFKVKILELKKSKPKK